MGRGKHFDHKKKNHPGEFPNHTLVERHTTEAQEDEELYHPKRITMSHRKHLKIALKKTNSSSEKSRFN